jgi:hypothetical protein
MEMGNICMPWSRTMSRMHDEAEYLVVLDGHLPVDDYKAVTYLGLKSTIRARH